MKTNRRKFLGFLGGAAVAGPSAAKAAAGNVLEKAGVRNAAGLTNGALTTLSDAQYSSDPTSLKAIIEKFGIPWFQVDEIKQRTRFVAFLDTDIGSLVSVSPSAQHEMQRRRNFTRAMAEARDFTFLKRQRSRDEWRKKHGEGIW